MSSYIPALRRNDGTRKSAVRKATTTRDASVSSLVTVGTRVGGIHGAVNSVSMGQLGRKSTSLNGTSPTINFPHNSPSSSQIHTRQMNFSHFTGSRLSGVQGMSIHPLNSGSPFTMKSGTNFYINPNTRNVVNMPIEQRAQHFDVSSATNANPFVTPGKEGGKIFMTCQGKMRLWDRLELEASRKSSL